MLSKSIDEARVKTRVRSNSMIATLAAEIAG